jgi:hypothetical protein
MDYPTELSVGSLPDPLISNGSLIIRPRLPYLRCKTARRKPKPMAWVLDSALKSAGCIDVPSISDVN